MLTAPERERLLVLEGIDVVDPQGEGRIVRDQRVRIADGRIIEVADAGVGPIDAAARVIDGRGRFLVPGLWDSHAHTLRMSPQLHFPLSIAQGVTTMRDMGDACSWSSSLQCRPDHSDWERQRASGRLIAPRIVRTASFHFEEAPGSEQEARRSVQTLRARGDGLIKLQLPDAGSSGGFVTLLEAARDAGIPAVGHVPFDVDLLAVTDRLRSVEHDAGLLVQCSAARADYDGKNRNKPALLEAFDASRCEQVLRAMALHGTAYVPTHIASSGQDDAFARGVPLEDRSRIERLVIGPLRMLWSGLRSAGEIDDSREREAVKAFHRRALALTLQAHTMGVTLLAGSDALDADVLHGYGLHRELEFLVEAGLTPAQALAAATTMAARYFGEEAESGRVAAGYRADVLILEADPLQDIRHLQRIEYVIADGRVHGPKERKAMTDFVARNAHDPAQIARFLRGLWRD